MRCLKLILFVTFSLLLFSGNARHAGHVRSQHRLVKARKVYSDKAFSDDNKQGDDCVKRKVKPKGREVAEPQLSSLALVRYCYFQVHETVSFSGACSSFLYCSYGKRGPPLC